MSSAINPTGKPLMKQAIPVLVFMLVLGLLLVTLAGIAGARTIYVDDDGDDTGTGSQDRPFNTIQKGVNAAGTGDRIFIHEGTYYEAVVVNRSILMECEANARAIINGSGNDGKPALTINEDWVELDYLVIEASSVGIHAGPKAEELELRSLSLVGNTLGLRVEGADNISITSTTITANQLGIRVENGSEEFLISNSAVYDNQEGLNATGNQDVDIWADRNYWGHKTGPYQDKVNPLGKGNNVSGPVNFRPWYQDSERQNLRFGNEEEESEQDLSKVFAVTILLLVLVSGLLIFLAWLPHDHYETARKWFVATFELDTMKESDRFWIRFALYFLALMVTVFLADLAAISIYEESDSLHPLQTVETYFVAEFQEHVLGIKLTRDDNVIHYNVDQEFRGHTLEDHEKRGGVSFEVSATCSGFHETVFLSVLILGFYGVSWRKKLKWAGIMAVVIFIENLARMAILFPYYLVYGKEEGELLHYNWWHHYQYIFIMGLFLLWFWFVARKDMEEQLDKIEAKEKKEKSEWSSSAEKKESVEAVSEEESSVEVEVVEDVSEDQTTDDGTTATERETAHRHQR